MTEKKRSSRGPDISNRQLVLVVVISLVSTIGLVYLIESLFPVDVKAWLGILMYAVIYVIVNIVFKGIRSRKQR